jgi:hypothetical protein
MLVSEVRWHVRFTSKSGHWGDGWDVRFVPIADLSALAKVRKFLAGNNKTKVNIGA